MLISRYVLKELMPGTIGMNVVLLMPQYFRTLKGVWDIGEVTGPVIILPNSA
jgi:hypothetical protein